MKIEQRKEINWSQYVSSINNHKSRKMHPIRERQIKFNPHISLRKKPSFKKIKDLSTTIDHTVMLYNQLKSTTSFSEGSQVMLKNDLTTASTCAYPQLTKRPINCKQIYKTEVYHAHTSSRNKLNTVYNDTLRIESLSQFKDSISKERINIIINKLSSDTLLKQSLTQDNISESIDMQISSHRQTKDLFNVFLSTLKNYDWYMRKEKEKEFQINSDLRERVNDLKVEISRLEMRKNKLMQKMDILFKMKFFLLCVKNRSENLDDFNPKSFNEHKKDRDRKKLIDNEYRRIDTAKLNKKNSSNNRRDSSPQINNRLEKEIVNHSPKENKPIFDTEEDFLFVFDDIGNHFRHLLKKQNEMKEECDLAKAELNEIDIQNNVNQIEISIFNKKISVEEVKLNKIKERNSELEALKVSMLKVYSKTLKMVQDKIIKMYKEVNAEFPLKLAARFKDKSIWFSDLESIEHCINYLITRRDIFKAKNKQAYSAFKVILDERTLDRLIALKKRTQEEKILERMKRVYARKNKVLVLANRKVGEKYAPLSNRVNPNSTENRISMYRAINNCLEEN